MESLLDAMEIQLWISPPSLGGSDQHIYRLWRQTGGTEGDVSGRDASLPLLYAFGTLRGSGPFLSPCRLDGEIL